MSAKDQQIESLRHLVELVLFRNAACGSPRVLATVLASIYNGGRVKVSLNDLGRLTPETVEHVSNVLRLHMTGGHEIHNYFDPGMPLHDPTSRRGGNLIFEKIIESYDLEKPTRRRPS